MSRYSQREAENEDQFNLLANKLSSLRSITEDINNHAQNSEVIEGLSLSFGSMMSSVKNTASHLGRSMGMGTLVWRTVFILLVGFFVVWTLMKLF